MKNLLFLANWKSNITKPEAESWLYEFSENQPVQNTEVVVLPPFTLLDFINLKIKSGQLSLKLGAQDLSPFGSGAFTGEVNALQIKEFADYVLIGHSERRVHFLETNEMVNNKINKALESGLKPVVCVSDLKQVEDINRNEIIIAYEPISAIGTGNPEDPDAVDSFCRQIKLKFNVKILYGGSVNSENVNNYSQLEIIDGVLVGKESLSAASFINLVKNAI
jgi:triosephosphate isomerase (TIM)